MKQKSIPFLESQEQLTPNQPEFLNTKMTLSRWSFSKFYLYGLVSRNVISRYYFEFDQKTGKGKGKVFYNQDDIRKALSTKPKIS